MCFAESSIVQQKPGEAVAIKMNIISEGVKNRDDKHVLREIEKTAVQKYKEKRKGNESRDMIDDLIEECITLFEGLKISSIVIQLLAQHETSRSKILSMIQSGNVVDWLLTIIDEKDKRFLSELGDVHLQVLVYVNTAGNLGRLTMKKGKKLIRVY